MKATIVQIREPGGLDRLEVFETDLPDAGPGDVLVRQKYAGVNFIDVYHRTGHYALPRMPAVLGIEASGEVAAVGPEVTDLAVGDRVAYAGAVGGYASARVLPASRLIKIPDAVPDDIAAVSLARGITALMLLEEVYPVTQGTTVLIHAAAGGLGMLLTEWAKRRGATVIGTVGSDAKAPIARAAGADHVIVGRDADLAGEIARLTGGQLVEFAVDGIGGEVLLKTFDCVRAFGWVASIGQPSGKSPVISIDELGPRRSIGLMRPSVMRFMTDPVVYRPAAEKVFAEVAVGAAPTVSDVYPLASAREALRDLESGSSTGCLVLSA